MSARYRSTCIINEKHLLGKGGNLDDYLPQLLMVNGDYLLAFDKMPVNCQNPINKCIITEKHLLGKGDNLDEYLP